VRSNLLTSRRDTNQRRRRCMRTARWGRHPLPLRLGVTNGGGDGISSAHGKCASCGGGCGCHGRPWETLLAAGRAARSTEFKGWGNAPLGAIKKGVAAICLLAAAWFP